MSFTRDDEREYDRKQEAIAEARERKVHFAIFSYEDSARGTIVASHPICRHLASYSEEPGVAVDLSDDDAEVTCKRCLARIGGA